MPGLAFDIQSWTDRGCSVLEVAGDLDAHAAGMLREELAAIPGRPLRLVVVMDRVTLLDETGLGVLLAAAKRARDSGGGIALAGCRGQVRRALDTKALGRILNPCGSLQDALALLGQQA